jgi:addiction module RelB/DinJ family antitoxin
MNALFRARVDKKLLQQAQSVCQELGLDTQEAVRLFLAALVRRRELPFKVSTETPEDELLQPQARRMEIMESFYEH